MVKIAPMPNTLEPLLHGNPAHAKAKMQKLIAEQADIDRRLEKKR